MRKKYLIMITVLILFAGYIFVECNKTIVKSADYEEKINASMLAKQCYDEIKKLKLDKNIAIDKKTDINETGLIGQDYSLITTTLGKLEAKRTSTNPNMAAVLIDMFNELGLKKGDYVAVNCSSSFPALNIAALCAIQIKGLNPVMITSVGSSTYGANNVELTYLDMEHYLYEMNLISSKTEYFSLGGEHDLGQEIDASVKNDIIKRLESYGYRFIYYDDMTENIIERYNIYNKANNIKCFINIGGNEASFGDSTVMTHVNGGILTHLPERDNTTGLVQLYLKENVPVIHILNINNLAVKYGIPVDPCPIPDVGEGDIYYTYKYNKTLSLLILLVSTILMLCYCYCRKRDR